MHILCICICHHLFAHIFLQNTSGGCFCFVQDFTNILNIFFLDIVQVPDYSRPFGISSAITNTVHSLTQTLKRGQAIFEIKIWGKNKNCSRWRKSELSNTNIYRFCHEETSERVQLNECLNKVFHRVRLSKCSS